MLFVARWNGTHFIYWRHKFGEIFLEEICCPEDDKYYDVFYAYEEITAPMGEEIPLK